MPFCNEHRGKLLTAVAALLLSSVLSAQQIQELADRGIITREHARAHSQGAPTLDYFPLGNRRDDVWLPAVTELIAGDLRSLGYARLGAQ